MMKLGIFCAGSLGKEIYDLAIRINEIESRWSEIFFVDNNIKAERHYGQYVYNLESVLMDKVNVEFVIANGEPRTRELIFSQLGKAGCKITNLIDPTAIVSKTAKLGKGVIVTPFSTISSDVQIGDNVLIQSYICIGHDIIIDNNSVISANVAIGGGSHIGRSVFIGMGASVLENIDIGDYAIVGMGAVLYQNIETEITVVGNPARITKGNNEKRVFG